MPDSYPVSQLHPKDNAAIADRAICADEALTENGLCSREEIPANHKVALVDIPKGAVVRKYGEAIGRASRLIRAGEHVHIHNVKEGDGWLMHLARALGFGYEFAVDHPNLPQPLEENRQFLGIERPDGRVGTRNYAVVASTGNCAKHTAIQIAKGLADSRQLLKDFPNVDGIIPITNDGGCGMMTDGFTHRVLKRSIQGMQAHPNVYPQPFLIGLGCETNSAEQLVQIELPGSVSSEVPPYLKIQDNGGIEDTIQEGRQIFAKSILPQANKAVRRPVPFNKLVVALECGSSGPKSGRTANPLLGWVSKRLAAEGLTVVLTETTEACGAEHLLTRRAKSKAVGKKLLRRLAWWKHYARLFGTSLDHDISLVQRFIRYFQSGTLSDNLSEGNIRAGLTTIAEKALAAVMKAGNQTLNKVYDYAEQIGLHEGFVLMDGPGNDPLATYGQVAGGAQIVLFTTQGGNCSGVLPASMLKVCACSETFSRLGKDMDFNADRPGGFEVLGPELIALIKENVEGRPSLSEEQGIGIYETVGWNPGGIL